MKLPVRVVAFLLLASSSVCAQEYDVVFHRDSKVGDKNVVRIKFALDDDQQFVINGTPTSTSKQVRLEVDLTAQFEEIAVDKNGRPTEEKVTIQSCRCTRDGEVVSLFKAGDMIEIEESRPKQFTVNGHTAAGLQRTLLTEMFPPAADAPHSDDRMFGPGRKVKAGESWPVNPEVALPDLAKKLGVKIPKEALKGTVKLESVSPKNGVLCLQLSGELQLSTADVPLPGAPPEIKAKKFELSIKLGGDFPVDPKLQRVGETVETHSRAEGGGTIEKDGKKSEITFRLVRSQKREAAIIPPS